MKYPVSLISWILVLLQALSLGYLFYSAPVRAIRIDLQIWELSGLFLAISGLVGLNRHSFSVFPEPKPKGRLFTGGVYAFIRHPMYAGVLIITGTLAIQFSSPERWVAFFLLVGVFILKIHREESFLAQRFPEYQEYQQQTNRLIPFIW